MENYFVSQQQDFIRRRRERYLIIALCIVISFLTYLGIRVFDLGLDLPFSSSIFVFVLININVILLLLLLFLTVRNLVKLLFERRKNIMGARLRTKLVLAFVTLSLLPTIILFFVSVQFISLSIEYWFNLPIERSLKNSVEVGQDFYKEISDEILSLGNNLSRVITYEGFMLLARKEGLEKFIADKQKEYHLVSISVFSGKLEKRTVSQDHRIDLSSFKGPGKDTLQEFRERNGYPLYPILFTWRSDKWNCTCLFKDGIKSCSRSDSPNQICSGQLCQ
jgi:two-component system nitrogen regulation sensor histidine kinase NtrY